MEPSGKGSLVSGQPKKLYQIIILKAWLLAQVKIYNFQKLIFLDVPPELPIDEGDVVVKDLIFFKESSYC